PVRRRARGRVPPLIADDLFEVPEGVVGEGLVEVLAGAHARAGRPAAQVAGLEAVAEGETGSRLDENLRRLEPAHVVVSEARVADRSHITRAVVGVVARDPVAR